MDNSTVGCSTEELKQLIQADVKEEGLKVGSSSPGNVRNQLRLVPVAEMLRDTGPPEYLIDGIIEVGNLGIFYGDPGSLKSFLSLDCGLCVATGSLWNGRTTKQGPVIAFIGEGNRGYGRRMMAWSKGHGRYIGDAPFFVSSHPAQILDKAFMGEAARVIEELENQHGRVHLAIFDTVARSFGPGDENSTSDMSAFIAGIDTLLHPDTAKLLVHHSGHGDKGRARGSSALRAAADVEYMLTKKSDHLLLTCTKSKDSEEIKPITLKPQVVEIGTPEDPATSLYLKMAKTPIREEMKLSPQMRQALSLLQLMTRKSGISCMSDWMNICRDEEVYTKSAFYNAIKTMEERNIVKITGDYVELY